MKAIRPLRKLLDRAHRRFIRSRPGSVLILVVALLVLMALIGTAFMTMAQFDRAASVQHAFNTEVDLLVDGVINQVKATVTGDLFANGNFRPSLNPQYDTTMAGSYSYYDGVGLDLATATANAGAGGVANPGNPWLASRVPDLLINLTSSSPAPAFPTAIPAGPASAANVPAWPFVSAPLNGSGLFDTPYWQSGSVRYTRPNTATIAEPALVPGAIALNGVLYPAFTNVRDPSAPGKPVVVLAADADGDGQADSGMYKLLSLDGITYYAAVRIVDNCAAVNANIACTSNPAPLYVGTPSATTTMPGDFSPVNVDLADMSADPVLNFTSLILNYRFNNQLPGFAVDDNGATRSDFAWIPYSQTVPSPYGSLYFDQQWAQLGRRLQNPGNVINGSTTAAAKRFQALPITESMIMAKNFILVNPSTFSTGLTSSVLEQYFPQTAIKLASPSPYPLTANPLGATNWYNSNFNYNTTSVSNAVGPMSMRPLWVARNPVSNFCPNKFNFTHAPGASYKFGDVQTFQGHQYVCICSNPPSLTPVPPDQYWTDMFWAYEPWMTAPTKTSVNTGTFQQLYAAYWATMCTQPNVPPVPNVPGGSQMFRSPLRSETSAVPSATPPVLNALQVLNIRAAIAAVNTMDLRDSDDDVTSRTIEIPPNLFVTVYGIEKQPYVTQVYAQNDEKDPTKDWAAIELYNPYPSAISLKNWQVVAATRTASPITLKNIAPIPLGTTIPPRSYLVLMDSSAPPSSVTITTGSSNTNVVQIPQLAQNGLGTEVFIMRPRLANGTLSRGIAANNTYNETSSATTANDLVPVDCYDFTNMPATAKMGQAVAWHYFRPSAAGKNWHFVYPGPWNLTTGAAGSAKLPTLSATKNLTPVPTSASPEALNLGGTGQTQFSVNTYVDVPLQLNNTDFGGPNKSTNILGQPNIFPYGTFARNGDILQVPFIGSYKIWTGNDAAQKIYELNPVTMDSITATAYDQNVAGKTGEPIATASAVAENIGRFAPIDKADAAAAFAVGGINDFAPPLAGGAINPVWRYHWAMQLFDFLTVQSPQDDYSPNVDPAAADYNYGYLYRYKAANATPTTPNMANLPTQTSNANPQVANAGLTNNAAYDVNTPQAFNNGSLTEETAPVDGLINVNTAPWRVLATVPWMPATSTNYATANVSIAQGIVRYRDVDDQSGATPKHGHGPFKSLFELNQVLLPGGTRLREILTQAVPPATPTSTGDYSPAYGNISPLQTNPPGGTDGVVGDFESRYNLITRVSNLVTTRSDSYTAYILVQGWRNAETNNPTLVVQRRAAIILDRSGVTPSNTSPTVVNVPE